MHIKNQLDDFKNLAFTTARILFTLINIPILFIICQSLFLRADIGSKGFNTGQWVLFKNKVLNRLYLF